MSNCLSSSTRAGVLKPMSISVAGVGVGDGEEERKFVLFVLGVNLVVESSLLSGTLAWKESGEDATSVIFAFMRRCGGVASVSALVIDCARYSSA